MKYFFYISRFVDGEWETDTDIIENFPGMVYLSAKNLNSYGKVKNIYTESYAESDELRAYIPTNPKRDNPDIELEFGFIDTINNERRDTFMQFVDWLTGHKLRYWDTCRRLRVEMVLIDKIDLTDDYLYGSTPFLTATFKFKNLYGKAERVSESEI